MKKKLIFIASFLCVFSISPSEGNRIRESRYSYQDYIVEDEKFGELREKWSRKYDSSGNTQEEKRMHNGSIGERVKYTFDNRQKLVEINVENDMGEKKRVVYHYRREKLVGKDTYKNGALVAEESHTYDKNGKLKYVKNKRGATTGYIYDKNGMVIMKNDGVVTNYYAYDANGNIERDRCEIDGEVMYDRAYIYDSEGNIVKMVEELTEGTKEIERCIKETKYKYNARGDKIEERWRETGSKNWHIKRLENKYNTNGDLVEIKEYEVKVEEEVPIRDHYYEYEYY